MIKRSLFFALLLPMLLIGVERSPYVSYLFDDENLLNWGLIPQELEVGCIGENELSPYVRITAINGILNHKSDCLRTAEFISETHGNSPVHYVYWNSDGWTEDVIKGLFAKLGYVSRPAIELAELWKNLIAEMGGVEGEGEIIHYAHSIGATETLAASQLLTPEELRKLHVITMGPASIIPPDGFGSVMNYISYRDGVPTLDPWNFYRAYRGELPHVLFVGDFEGYFPFGEHSVQEGTYLKLLEICGENFKNSIQPNN